jgi:valyl-tRNA synthetase
MRQIERLSHLLAQSEYISIRQDQEKENLWHVCASTEQSSMMLEAICESVPRDILQTTPPGMPAHETESNATTALVKLVVELGLDDSSRRSVFDALQSFNTTCHYFHQENDVLDTWFSSQLWPHSTLGWPEDTPDLKFYYPTSVLVTSRDIITLWVARMVIAGLYNCREVPFRDVYIHPKILDGFGQTMSKTKGNGVDPLDIVEKYGADALRFGLAYLTTESQDARMPVGYECPHCQEYIPQKLEHQQMKPKGGKNPRIKCPSCKKDFQFSSPNFDPDPGEPVARVVSERFEMGRNFANKLWNAARFALMNLEDYAANQKSLGESPLTPDPSGRLEHFRFSEAAKAIYDFAWGEFCDWYVEMAKLRLRDPAARSTAQCVLATVLDHLVRLLHPIMPFLAEEIWQALCECAPERGVGRLAKAADSVMIARWPEAPAEWRSLEVEKRMARLQELIKSIRNIRSNFNVDNRSRVCAHVRCSDEVAGELSNAQPFIEQLATVDELVAGPAVTKPADSASAVAAEWELYVPLSGLIDRPAEIARNQKLLQALAAHLKSFQAKLSNADFVAKAPPDVVEMHRQRRAELEAQQASVEAILRELRST